jgi:hypothetical protein
VNESNKPHMDELREHLMATLASLRDRESPMDVDRARAVAQVAGVLVETAKVEVEFIKATNGDSSSFIGQGQGQGLSDCPRRTAAIPRAVSRASRAARCIP